MTLKRDAKGHFLPGSGGRPAGTRNKLHAGVFRDYTSTGRSTARKRIRIVCAEDPTAY